jgi:hypothetical protein
LNRCNKVQCAIRLNVAEGQGAKPAPILFYLISIFIYLLDFMIILIMLDLIDFPNEEEIWYTSIGLIA